MKCVIEYDEVVSDMRPEHLRICPSFSRSHTNIEDLPLVLGAGGIFISPNFFSYSFT